MALGIELNVCRCLSQKVRHKCTTSGPQIYDLILEVLVVLSQYDVPSRRHLAMFGDPLVVETTGDRGKSASYI